MKKLLVIATLFLAPKMYAQDGPGYESAVGAKLSAGVAASYKKFVTSTNAVEAQAMFFKEGVRLVGLYEFHFYNIEGLPGLGWYVGPGAHIGFWRKNYKDTYNSRIDLGIDGVIGIDYRIKNTPINLSLDWQPSYSIAGTAGLMPSFGGLAIRYVLQ
jgi:hypothetical protein